MRARIALSAPPKNTVISASRSPFIDDRILTSFAIDSDWDDDNYDRQNWYDPLAKAGETTALEEARISEAGHVW